MEQSVIFRDRQELQADDLSNIGAFAKQSLDHIVADGIQDGKGWVDFQVLKSSTAEVTVKPGRLYNGGAVYISTSDVVFDLLSELPAINRKWVAIVAWGQEVETDTQPRDFLIDATTGATQAQAVTMQSLRKAVINTVVGVTAAQPAKPSIDSSNTVIAWLLLSPGDVESITLVEANTLPNLAVEQDRIDDLQDWRDTVGPRVDSLASDIARLRAEIEQMGKSRLIEEVAVDVARLKELTFKHISTGYTLAASTRSFKVIATLENYAEANHDLTCTIAANGGATEIAPGTTSDEVLDPPVDARDANHKRIRRTFTWTSTQITAAMSSVRITMNGATTSALDTFHVAERVHLAF